MNGDRMLGLLKQVRSLLSKEAVERELDEEIQFHVEREAERLVSVEGLEPREARRRALVAFGGVERTKERVRQARWTRFPEDVGRDIHYGLRSLRARWGIALAAVIVLALGIGASVMIYDTGRALATDAVPFPTPERLVTVSVRGERGQGMAASLTDYQSWQAGTSQIATLGAYAFDEFFVGDGSETFRVTGARITRGFFEVLGVQPLVGRWESSSEVAGSDAAILSERLWATRFGSDAAIIGRSIRIDGRPRTVIGIVRAGEQFPPFADLYTSFPALDTGVTPRVVVLGRLSSQTTTAAVEAALATIQAGLDRDRPASDRVGSFTVEPLSGQPQGENLLALMLVQCSVLVLLLITSANAAGLMLTRTIERRREFAVRTSLGASRSRIVRQIFVESALLAASAGLLGLAFAQAGITVLRNGVPEPVSRGMLGWERLGLDGNTLFVALIGMPVLATILVATLPSLRATRRGLVNPLREEPPTASSGRRGSRVSRFLLSTEVALSLTLLLIAGLLARSLALMLEGDPGFEAEGVLAVEWAQPPQSSERSGDRFHVQLLERLHALPGVAEAAIGSNVPMSRAWATREYKLTEADPESDSQYANWRSVTESYMETLGIPVLLGRTFSQSDDASAVRVAIISEAMANRHWQDGNALGRQIDADGRTWTVVGIAGDVHETGVNQRASPTIYVPHAQSPLRSGYLVVRVTGDPTAFIVRLREEVRATDPDVAIGEVATLSGMVHEYYGGDRLMVELMAAFALASLLITIVSLYALAAHAMARRRREIGIRLALGAVPRQIVASVVKQNIAWVAAGIMAGLLLAAGVAQLLAAMLYGVRPTDPVVFVLVPSVVLVSAVVASYVPARRVTTVDPTRALRVG